MSIQRRFSLSLSRAKKREAFSRFSYSPFSPSFPLSRDPKRSDFFLFSLSFSSRNILAIALRRRFFFPFFLFLLLLFLSYFFLFFFLHPRHARVVKDVQHGASCRYVSQCSSDDVIGVHERRLNERSFGAFADERNCSYVNALDCVNGHSTTRTYVRMYVRTWVGRRIGK